MGAVTAVWLALGMSGAEIMGVLLDLVPDGDVRVGNGNLEPPQHHARRVGHGTAS